MNIRPPYYSNDIIRYACENATIIKISDEELPKVMVSFEKSDCSTEQSAQFLSDKFKNLKIIIITKGEKGSIVYECADKKFYNCDAKKVDVVSTVGAGDSFSASFLMLYLKTKDISASLDFAAKISGYVVSQKAAVPDYDISDYI